tara:strand:- start:17251 stop:18621 length:1371 start_codon:yes stop_codon:yes gene_type:complete
LKIIILGAGTVGSTLATLLSKEDNDITVVDQNENSLHRLEEDADIKSISGSCSYPNNLVNAGIEKADMVVAVTGSDEINIVSCLISKVLSPEVKTIARIRESSYLKNKTKDAINSGSIPVDIVVSPEKLITNHIQALIETPGSLQVLEFGEGLLNLVGVRAVEGGPLIGHEISDLKKHMPNVDTRVAAIFRGKGSIIPKGTTTVMAGDEVFFIARRKDAKRVINEMRKKEEPYKYVVIAGGGKIGSALAEQIESNHRVKVIESNAERAKVISENLVNTIVLEGNVSDRSLLHEENIEECDVFVALTNDDEANVMSCMLAKEMGAHKVIALINNDAYVDLMEGKNIDIAVAPSQITIGTFLSELAGDEVVKVHSLRRGAAEAIETIVKPSENGKDDVIGKELGNINLPLGATIGAIIRKNKAKIAHDDVKLRENDHVILFLTDKKLLPQIKDIFSPY